MRRKTFILGAMGTARRTRALPVAQTFLSVPHRQECLCHPIKAVTVAPHPARAGFTLVELMVVIGILLLIAAMTLSVVNLSITGDRTRGAARQVQSYLEGARGRAIYGGNQSTKGFNYQAGVRFIRDANNPTLVTSLQFVEIDPANSSMGGGVFVLARLDNDNDNVADSTYVYRLIGTVGSPIEQANTHWLDRYAQGLIYDYQTIILDNRKYQILTTLLQAGLEQLLLTTPYVGTIPSAYPAVVAVPVQSQPPYQILLAPQPMPNQEPRLLGNGIVLDLNLSKNYAAAGSQIDIMFSPRGTVVGPLSGTGIVQFAVTDREDSLKGAPLAWTVWQGSTAYPLNTYVISTNGDTKSVFRCTNSGTSASSEPTWVRTLGSTTSDNSVTWTCVGGPKRERMLISLTPQTGKAAVHPIYLDPLGATLDPYRYAETGEVAKQ